MSSIQQKQFIHGYGSTVSESEPWTAAFIAWNGVFVNVDDIILKTYSDYIIDCFSSMRQCFSSMRQCLSISMKVFQMYNI